MSLEIKNIKSLNDLDTYIEGCLNDFKFDLSTQEETKEYLLELISHLLTKNKGHENKTSINAQTVQNRERHIGTFIRC